MLPPDAVLASINDHLVEPADLWRGQRDGPHVATVGGVSRWVFGGESLPIGALSILAADEVSRATMLSDIHPAVHDPAARLRAMDRDGVSVHTVLPHVIGFAGERLRHLDDAKTWAAAVRRYNDYVVDEFCGAAPDRLFACAVVAFADPASTVREMHRAAAIGCRAVSLPHAPTNFGLLPYGDESWAPVFDAAQALEWPVMIHVGSSGAPPSINGASVPGAILVQGGFDVIDALTDLLFGYVLVRHPQLKVVLLEGGGSWLPFVQQRIEFFARQRPEVWAPPSRVRTPAEMIREQIYVSFIEDEITPALLAVAEPDHLLWQCDFPHADSPWPASRDRLAQQLTTIDDATSRAIAGANTLAVLAG